MLAISCSRAFGSSLISSPVDMWTGTDGPAPDMADLFGESCVPGVVLSRGSCDRLLISRAF